MEPEVSLPCTQARTTGHRPEPVESTPRNYVYRAPIYVLHRPKTGIAGSNTAWGPSFSVMSVHDPPSEGL
jgi:hypothetical protein